MIVICTSQDWLHGHPLRDNNCYSCWLHVCSFCNQHPPVVCRSVVEWNRYVLMYNIATGSHSNSPYIMTSCRITHPFSSCHLSHRHAQLQQSESVDCFSVTVGVGAVQGSASTVTYWMTSYRLHTNCRYFDNLRKLVYWPWSFSGKFLFKMPDIVGKELVCKWVSH